MKKNEGLFGAITQVMRSSLERHFQLCCRGMLGRWCGPAGQMLGGGRGGADGRGVGEAGWWYSWHYKQARQRRRHFMRPPGTLPGPARDSDGALFCPVTPVRAPTPFPAHPHPRPRPCPHIFPDTPPHTLVPPRPTVPRSALPADQSGFRRSAAFLHVTLLFYTHSSF